VDQVAALWRSEDGDLAAFARAQFVSDDKKLAATLERYERTLEQLDGCVLEIGRAFRTPTELDVGPLLPLDPLLATYDPGAHAVEDLFQNKVAFAALLNFPSSTLAERAARAARGKPLDRREWAEARLTGRFARRVPGEVRQEIARAGADADLYIAEYNVWMHHLIDEHGHRPFPRGMRLIAHWNLRDELKADYADGKDGPAKQRLILQVMERIVTQTIPRAVIDDPRLDWDPFTNQVTPSPAAEIEPPKDKGAARPGKAQPSVEREPDVRYEKLLAQFHAMRRADPFSPTAPTAIARAFEAPAPVGRELPEKRVVQVLEELLTSPLVARVAKVIARRLGRPLEPQDLWYDGFQARAAHPQAELDGLTRKRYPTAAAFAADIPRILEALGFDNKRAAWLASHIVVDPARGAGHALQAERRGDSPHLRTRIEPGGMDYKGYNIAVHELGHNIEQVFSLYTVDHTLLAGVPGNAFTEALAFLFQARDLFLLGLGAPSEEADRLRVLSDFWQAWEIAGVALTDLAVWHWMYEHPEAKPAELRDATVAIARANWNKWYAPVLGRRDAALLGIYSHMIAYPLYLADYPLGHLIAFQIEEQVAKAGKLGPEFERIAAFGDVAPDEWMKHATGAPVGAGPLLRATERALSGMRK
jgi:hypothetical protein